MSYGSNAPNAVYCYKQYADGATSAPTATARESIHAALDGQDKALCELHETVYRLTEHLSSVLESEPPRPAVGNGVDSAPTPHHVLARVYGATGLVADASARLNALLSRVQL